MEMHEVIRQRRGELGLSQADLAARVGVDRRQIRRYEAGETHPTLPAAKSIASALGITLDELAGDETHRIDLSGDWSACWQSWKDGVESIRPQQVRMTQRGDTVELVAASRGAPLEGGGYLWRGEVKIVDNEALIGWYVADESAVRSKGSLYFSLHPHGLHATGRWVGLSYDGPIVSGWAALARTEDEAITLIDGLRGGDE
ncbi:helix-turn-helix transcriptional regulator [Pseudonocardia kunmingensis]|uniref:Helix-turn-helix protein n=1 Tax=Pseudonocardia kunmingensis TaxID=630975 RepID=A0A543CYI2_9PSEU|nr:helix-turn-helix transcriptional regulator [Pseudonocardia kunmingensis]TQM02139.1 helix-turn-helix protein [Pseudonocardia kunmingensis]